MALTSYQQIKQVQTHYNSIGEHFSQTRTKPMWLEIIPFIKQIKPGMRVLDVGCGNGRLLTEIKNKSIYYIGVDFSQTLIKQAKKRFPENKFLIRDITDDNDWKRLGSFDAVFCLGVMHHIPDRSRQHEVLQQIYKHTKPGGFAVFSVWNLWQFRFWKNHLSQIRNKLEYGNLSYVWIPYSVSDGKKISKTVMRFCKAYLPGEFIGLVKQVGFKVKTFYYASQGKTHKSIINGQNFCLQAFKKV